MKDWEGTFEFSEVCQVQCSENYDPRPRPHFEGENFQKKLGILWQVHVPVNYDPPPLFSELSHTDMACHRATKDLHRAAFEGDIVKMKELVGQGCSVDCTDEDGNNVLMTTLLGQVCTSCFPRVNHFNIKRTRFVNFQSDFWLRRTRFLISDRDFQRFLRSD